MIVILLVNTEKNSKEHLKSITLRSGKELDQPYADQPEQQVNNGKNVEIPSEPSQKNEVKKKEEKKYWKIDSSLCEYSLSTKNEKRKSWQPICKIFGDFKINSHQYSFYWCFVTNAFICQIFKGNFVK